MPHKVALRIDRYLSRDENQVAHPDRVRIRERAGVVHVARLDYLQRHGFSSHDERDRPHRRCRPAAHLERQADEEELLSDKLV